jgi:hypothetical protein
MIKKNFTVRLTYEHQRIWNIVYGTRVSEYDKKER